MLNIEKVHTYGELPDGRKGIIAKNPYTKFCAQGGPDVYLQAGTFYHADGNVISDPKGSLPDHVMKSLPVDFWEVKPVARPLENFSLNELETELMKRQASLIGTMPTPEIDYSEKDKEPGGGDLVNEEHKDEESA